ncbi:MAG: serine/threonine-protein kinase [Planctomycetota bacterium]
MATTLDRPSPQLDDATRSFVRRALSANLVQIDDLKKVVVSLMASNDRFTPERLADGLKHAGMLTNWQASKLLAGRSKGFYLGSYRLLRPLGQGGMGMVFLGEHHVMKRQMALKILPPEATDNPRRLQRFMDEARACAQLDHPNIVRAYDFAEAGGRYYIVMEYVDGIDLQRLVARDGVIGIREGLDVLSQSAAGLAHAHERGIVHRDIKPANLMLSSDGIVKVSDLGLARIGLSELSEEESRRLMGTADFIAPEQAINSTTADARSDIYSLGCTAYFLLTGSPPFAGGNVRERLAAHQTAPIPDPRSIRKECPAALAELITKMMAKRPEDRPKSVSAVLGQIQRMTKSPSSAGPVSRLNQVQPVAASDTSIDEEVYQATIEDSSLSADGEVSFAEEVTDVDFGNLPDFSSAAAVTSGSFAGLPTNASLSNGNGLPAAKKSASTPARTSGTPSGNQQVMLGVGLTMAFLSLITVLGLGAYSVLKEPETKTPVFKKMEQSDGTSVINVIQSP